VHTLQLRLDPRVSTGTAVAVLADREAEGERYFTRDLTGGG